ncbi:MAG: class I SAM-dependent methyltransferase [Bacilli bacterium]|nr:class I SAM-dependent methyltransferase [Bacilli bacterium]
MNEDNLITYYNKFNEDKRLKTKHGQVEFIVTMKYIHSFLKKGMNIIEIGAGTGQYSVNLANEGYNVTAVELVKHNLRVIEKKNKNIKTILGNAINLKMISDNTYDLTLLLGPMYHLISKEEKIQALNEAKRITKKDGIIMVAYCMNDYSVIIHGFRDNNIKESIKNNDIDEKFHITPKETDLYSRVTIDDINELNSFVNIQRINIISPDGPANYMRKTLNQMDEETFNLFIQYQLTTCERSDLIGAGAHTLDILKNTK